MTTSLPGRKPACQDCLPVAVRVTERLSELSAVARRVAVLGATNVLVFVCPQRGEGADYQLCYAGSASAYGPLPRYTGEPLAGP